jgi:hypothetical protein
MGRSDRDQNRSAHSAEQSARSSEHRVLNQGPARERPHSVDHAHLPEQELFVATFRFINPLATGDYLLVAAVQDRHLRDIYYLKCYEDAHYFSRFYSMSGLSWG